LAEDYEYRGMMARAWDLLRGDYSQWPDRPFWRAVVEARGGSALDVGCGTGRLLLDFVAAGLDVDGVDNSPEMLAICRDKAVVAGLNLEGRLFEGDMRALNLPRRYATIIVPSISIVMLTQPGDADRAVSSFHGSLEMGGQLVVSFTSKLWPGRRTPPHMEWSDWYKVAEAEQAEGDVMRRWMRARYDHAAQFEHEENRYERLREGEIVETEFHCRLPAARWYTQDQALALFKAAGFKDLAATSADTFGPAQPEDTFFKVSGTRS
jgi:ubiquinone/menaquinone biosynthesis C-methylase UbiE